MTAEIAQFDKVPLCNQPCLFSDPALWGRTGDLRFAIFGKDRERAITCFCPSVHRFFNQIIILPYQPRVPILAAVRVLK